MSLRLLRPPPPTLAERVLGRRRARVLRRRVGFAAVGVGLALLRPKPRRRGGGPLVAVTLVLVFVTVAGLSLPIR